ncbi:hypothetical protein M3Y98_00839000 [Aphelenchoides besseyi]|nr:hypothetical protein M3Y98_00839000 [Aphelenchoides besseyi]KAI6195493.1 hypothetical protein M3Y96_01237300 [Aphelenchoides besseyi]
MILIAMLIVLSAPIVEGILDDYHCGVGTVTKVISYGLSTLCGREKLNRCCKQHDKYIQFDNTFGDCIDRSYGLISGFILGASHSGVSKVFGGFYRAWEGDRMNPECRERNRQEKEERRRREEEERQERWEHQEQLRKQQLEEERQRRLIKERLRQLQ